MTFPRNTAGDSHFASGMPYLCICLAKEASKMFHASNQLHDFLTYMCIYTHINPIPPNPPHPKPLKPPDFGILLGQVQQRRRLYCLHKLCQLRNSQGLTDQWENPQVEQIKNRKNGWDFPKGCLFFFLLEPFFQIWGGGKKDLGIFSGTTFLLGGLHRLGSLQFSSVLRVFFFGGEPGTRWNSTRGMLK